MYVHQPPKTNGYYVSQAYTNNVKTNKEPLGKYEARKRELSLPTPTSFSAVQCSLPVCWSHGGPASSVPQRGQDSVPPRSLCPISCGTLGLSHQAALQVESTVSMSSE